MEQQNFNTDLVGLLNETKNVLPNQEGQIGYQKYSYADLGLILENVKPILKKYNFAIFQNVRTMFKDDMDMVIVKTTLIHISGEKLEQELAVPIGEDGRGTYIQKIGSTITYARRYSLSGLLAIATDLDDDGAHAGDKKPVKNKTEKKQVDKEAVIKAILGKTQCKEKDILGYLQANDKIKANIKSLQEIDVVYLQILENNAIKLKDEVEKFIKDNTKGATNE